eukprot:Ihof_evm5s32 gene=Ihof_evmTU5s32
MSGELTLERLGDVSPQLSHMLRQYSVMVPVREVEWPEVTLLSDWYFQIAITSHVLRHPTVMKYPPAGRYTRTYLKKFISLVEEIGGEVHDDILDMYTSLLMGSDTEEEYCYKTYWLDSGNIVKGEVHRGVTVRETVQMLSRGTTGLTTWKAALLLTEFILCNKTLLTNQKVVELGCGVGLAGMTACLVGSPSSMIFTDYNQDVLLAVKDNLNLNQLIAHGGDDCMSHDHNHNNHQLIKPKISVDRINWLERDHNQLTGYEADVIIASDVIYDDTVLDGLAQVLYTLLHTSNNNSIGISISDSNRNSDSNSNSSRSDSKSPVCYLANEIRNPATYAKFLELL